MPTYSIPLGAPTTILQNVVYALPAKAVYISTSVPCEVSLDGSTFAAPVAGQVIVASFIRCTTAGALVKVA